MRGRIRNFPKFCCLLASQTVHHSEHFHSHLWSELKRLYHLINYGFLIECLFAFRQGLFFFFYKIWCILVDSVFPTWRVRRTDSDRSEQSTTISKANKQWRCDTPRLRYMAKSTCAHPLQLVSVGSGVMLSIRILFDHTSCVLCVCIYTYVCIHMCVCACVCVNISMCVCKYMSIYLYMWIYVYVCIFIYEKYRHMCCQNLH